MPGYPEILQIIQAFYDIAKKDVMIGYHFRVIADFDEHIPRIADFWNLQLNGKMHDKSQLPFQLIKVHIPLKINQGEIHRWVKLFNDNLESSVAKELIDEKVHKAWMEKVDHFKEKLRAAI